MENNNELEFIILSYILRYAKRVCSIISRMTINQEIFKDDELALVNRLMPKYEN